MFVRRFIAILALVSCGGPSDDDKTVGSGDTDSDSDADTDTDTDTDTDSDGDSDADTDNDSFATADPIDPGTVDDAIESPGDRDTFAFVGEPGHVYVLRVEGGGDLGRPDSVLQVYDPDLVLIGENDDLPFRMYGTDAGFLVRARQAGTYYAVVSDWADWAGYPPEGGPDYTYTLHLDDEPTWQEPTEDRFADDDTPVQAAGNVADLDGDGNVELPFVPTVFGEESGYYEARGAIDPAGDEDWLWMASVGTGLFQFSLFPGVATDLDPIFELWREDCVFGLDCDGVGAELVATTPTPEVGPDYRFLYSGGIVYPAPRDGVYYLRIADRTGGGGIDRWYTAFWGAWDETFAVPELEDGSTDLALAQAIPASLGSVDPTFRYARFTGFLEGNRLIGSDVQDAWLIDWGAAGDTLQVLIDTVAAGSFLADAEVEIWHEDAPETWSLLASGSGADPSIENLVLADDARLVVTFASASGAEGPDRYYVGYLTATAAP